MDIDAVITLPVPGMTTIDAASGPSGTDLMLGGRFSCEFGGSWHWRLRVDVFFGGTEGIVNGLAATGYTIGRSGLLSLDLGYRHMQMDLEGATPSLN